MAWPPTPTGRTAAEYPLEIHGGGNISPYLLRQNNPYAEAIKAIAPALKEYLAQKRADEIANQYLNMEQPPRAEALDPSLQGAPPTQPNTGGERAYKADVLYRSLLNEQADRAQKADSSYWQNQVHAAQARKYNADADAPDPRGYSSESSPVVDSQTGMVWNGRQWVKPSRQADYWSMNMPLARGRLNDKGEFDNQYSEAASGDYVKLRTPKGETLVVPWSEYQRRATRQNPGAELYRSKVQGAQPPLQEPDLPSDTSGKEEDFARAREAIAKGADPTKVRKRLEDVWGDSTGL